MGKQGGVEILKIQPCVLKVHIHCDGCKQKVKKLLQKVDGVYTINIDSEKGKVTVTGDVDPYTLIRKLQKGGKHAELWGSNGGGQNLLNNQFLKMQIDGGKGQKDGKGQKGGKDLKGLPLKLPQFKNLKMPFKATKSVKFNLPEDDEFIDEFDYFDDDGFDDDDEFDDAFDDDHEEMVRAKHPMNGNGMVMMGATPHGMSNKGGTPNGQKGGGADLHFQDKSVGVANSVGKNGSVAKNGGGNNGYGSHPPSQQGGGAAKKNGGKNGGTQDQKGGGNDGGNKNGPVPQSGGGNNPGSGKKGGPVPQSDGFGMGQIGMMPQMAHLQMGHRPMGQVGHPQMGQLGHPQMGHHSIGQMGHPQMGGQMGNIPAVQGLPAAAAMNPNAYYQGGGVRPEMAALNPYQQQQYMAMLAQQRQNMERYARPQPATGYILPPMPPFVHYFSDENASGCSIM